MCHSISLSPIIVAPFTPITSDCQKSPWHGRIYSTAHRFLQSFFEKVCHVVFHIFYILKTLCDNPIALTDVFRNLHGHVLPYLQLRSGIPNHYDELSQVLLSGINVTDSIQIATNVDYFVNSKSKNDAKLHIAGRTALFTAHLGLCCLWLAQIGLINLEKLAGALGKASLFNVLPPAKLNFLVERAFGFSYACFAAEALDECLRAETVVHQNYAQLKLAKNSVDFILNLMLLTGRVNPVCSFVMGCVSIASGISCIVYKQRRKT
jgi:hypothetical protein